MQLDIETNVDVDDVAREIITVIVRDLNSRGGFELFDIDAFGLVEGRGDIDDVVAEEIYDTWSVLVEEILQKAISHHS